MAAAIVATLARRGPTTRAPPPTATGPSTTTPPYVLPVADDVRITSLLTVGDRARASNGYEMVGIPDGLGLPRDDGKAVLYLNQELRDTQGIVRRHGQTGAFVSRWVIDPQTARGQGRLRPHRSGRPLLGLPQRRLRDHGARGSRTSPPRT